MLNTADPPTTHGQRAERRPDLQTTATRASSELRRVLLTTLVTYG